MLQEPTIHIGIGDWVEKSHELNLDLRSDNDIINALIDKQMTSADVAEAIIARRHEGLSPKNIIKPDKILLRCGAQNEVMSKANRARHKVTTKSGKTFSARSYVGMTTHDKNDKEDDGDYVYDSVASKVIKDQAPTQVLPGEEVDGVEAEAKPVSYISYNSTGALDLAVRYLRSSVIGAIQNRLLTVYENGGDVRGVARELKSRIDELVCEIMGGK